MVKLDVTIVAIEVTNCVKISIQVMQHIEQVISEQVEIVVV